MALGNFAPGSMDPWSLPQEWTNYIRHTQQTWSFFQHLEGVESIESQVESQTSDIVDNVGSLKHPNFCMRPCIYFSQGLCRNGNSCNFCHLPHTNPRLDKRQRQFLREMPSNEVATLFAWSLRIKQKRAAQKNQWLPLEETSCCFEMLSFGNGSKP